MSRWLTRLPRVLKACGAEAAYLFGSYARDEADAYSDVDLLIVAPSARPFVDRFRDYRDVWLGAPTGVDLLIYTPDEFAEERRCNRFVRSVLRHARRIV
ncbi:MAG: nucleotidyltransferase domain-containing protein [Deltaproteobacteria bacterium]|nr:nucleotidyltransferase domain-containing protein [Deltaproteobacteria bacterium]MBI3390500.1 nucleotidyltransferase domain-containing protein [Deltaproteobacteria bacterium]